MKEIIIHLGSKVYFRAPENDIDDFEIATYKDGREPKPTHTGKWNCQREVMEDIKPINDTKQPYVIIKPEGYSDEVRKYIKPVTFREYLDITIGDTWITKNKKINEYLDLFIDEVIPSRSKFILKGIKYGLIIRELNAVDKSKNEGKMYRIVSE